MKLLILIFLGLLQPIVSFADAESPSSYEIHVNDSDSIKEAIRIRSFVREAVLGYYNLKYDNSCKTDKKSKVLSLGSSLIIIERVTCVDKLKRTQVIKVADNLIENALLGSMFYKTFQDYLDGNLRKSD